MKQTQCVLYFFIFFSCVFAVVVVDVDVVAFVVVKLYRNYILRKLNVYSDRAIATKSALQPRIVHTYAIHAHIAFRERNTYTHTHARIQLVFCAAGTACMYQIVLHSRKLEEK